MGFFGFFLKAKPEKKKKPQPQALLLGSGSVNLPPCDRVACLHCASASWALTTCISSIRQPQAWGVHAAPPEPCRSPGAGHASPGAREGGGYWGCARLIGMGEWRGTLNFLASARSSRSGCRGSTEPSPAACSCLPPASSPARSVLPLAHFASRGVAGCSSRWAGASDGCLEQSGLLFFFSAFWDSLLNGAIGRNLSRCKQSLFVQQLGGTQVLLCWGRSSVLLNRLQEPVSGVLTVELQVTG